MALTRRNFVRAAGLAGAAGSGGRGAARFWRGARGERQTQARTNLRLPARRVPVSVPTA